MLAGAVGEAFLVSAGSRYCQSHVGELKFSRAVYWRCGPESAVLSPELSATKQWLERSTRAALRRACSTALTCFTYASFAIDKRPICLARMELDAQAILEIPHAMHTDHEALAARKTGDVACRFDSRVAAADLRCQRSQPQAGGCKKFCVNGYLAGNCCLAWSRDDRRDETLTRRAD